MDFKDHPLATTVTAVTTGSKSLTSTVNNCVPLKGDAYLKNDDLYNQLPDLVNERFKEWYYITFHKLGSETVHKLAAIARQDAKKDRRKYFSWLLKNPDKVFRSTDAGV